MPTIYVILCEDDKYYVGKTSRPLQSRIKEHFENTGSEWTKMYKPVKVVEVIPDADDYDEDKYTKIYMKKYGIDNVRGGAYTRIVLPEYIEDELCSASDLCYQCKKDCYSIKTPLLYYKYDIEKADGCRCCIM